MAPIIIGGSRPLVSNSRAHFARRQTNQQQRPLVIALHCALWGAAALLPAASQAQSVPAGNTSPVTYTNTQPTPAPQNTVGANGTNGTSSLGYVITLQTAQSVKTSAAQTLFGVNTTGGNGGDAGMSNANYDQDGPLGGSGGAGGSITFNVAAPTDNGAYSVLENYAAGGNGVSLSSQGGNAGIGQQNETNGNGGVGGTGGVGGNITFNLPMNPNQPSALSYIEATGAAIMLQSTGGNGGDSGQSGDSINTIDVTGRKGGAGANGGNITATLAGNINGYDGGSGIVAVSQGGNGGDGGGAYANGAAKATGADGGDAGNGGNIIIGVTGGTVTAQGPAKAATGPQQNFDSSTDPNQTVPLDTSVTVGAILAKSAGGVGGQAGEVDGTATKGGNGAQGGTGGQVMITLGGSSLGVLNNNAVLSTTGYNAFGAMALSVGGNGGDSESGGGVYFRKGGGGGTGGAGGQAGIQVGNDTTTPYAKILTAGDDSDALVALSVGGGGGYSGDLNDSSGGGAFSVYIGGQGGNGGNGSTAYVSNGYYDPPPTDGSQAAFHPGDVIITTGTYSRGMVVQSVGGGGGRGGDATNTSLGSSVTIGGAGGNGGDGGLAQAVNFGLINTSGEHSDGIFSQSVGGGGGSGGGALSRAISGQVSVSIAVGGSGGKGGSALEADAYNLGQVQTLGANAHGIFAQAVGGGGGVGGTAAAQNYNVNLPDEPSISLTTAVGGKGGVAGNGGTIDVMNAGLLQTQGQDAYGVFAQSVGGGGGAGGDASATSMAYHQAKLAVSAAIGGGGGAGGNGGQVNVWNSGLISTASNEGIGIFAQSVGGGGGTGGSGTTDQGGLYQGGNYSTQLSVAVGGQGGAAGNGGNVVVNNYISSNSSDSGYFSDPGTLSDRDVTGAGGILTEGDMAVGIFAQSIGGGGGNGGASTGKGSNGQLNVNVAVGGAGGAGGNGGNVTVHNGAGAIQTYGAQSYGVMGQSVGGGGGNGGNAATGSGDDPEYLYPKLAFTLAANNYGKDPSGFTQVTDNVWDWKDNVKGAWDDKNLLEDLYETTHQIDQAPKPIYSGLTSANLTIDVGGGFGGAGGAGGNGGTVSIDSSGSILTYGPMAYGMFGQSVGGGGGVGGGAAPVTSNDKLHDSLIESAIAVGGTGGKGGDGGAVNLTNNPGGDIETSGDLSFGMLAQSVGGGGGVGGASLPNAGLGNAMALSFGASAMNPDNVVSGTGGTVTATNNGSITTSGDTAIGMVAQSVGGGGGIAAVMGQSQDSTTGLFHSTTQTLVKGVVTPTLAPNYDSVKNIGGNANVVINSGGTVATQGINAFGVLAQSIGGGGGLMVIDPNNPVTVNQLAPDPNNVAPSGGNKAGLVNVTTQGQTQISTSGAGAVGIVAQSLGGSGVLVNGFDGVNVDQTSSQVYQDRWDMGMGGAVTVNNNADITTTGAYADGIFAQVASGTGGVIGRSDGTGVVFRSGMGENMYCGGTSVVSGGDCGGAVNVNLQAGTVDVKGAYSWGVVMESENVSFEYQENAPKIDQSNTTLKVANGARIIAEGQSAGAVLINGTGTNTVDNAGVIDGLSSAGGYAINSVNKSFKVVNEATGTIAGSIGTKCSGNCADTGPVGMSSIDNNGLLETGDVVDLDGGELTNAGAVSVHGGSTGTTTLTGNYSGAGQLVFDADYAGGKSDQLLVNGSADVGGSVTVRPTTMRNATVSLMSATGGLTLEPQLVATPTELFTTNLQQSANTLYATPQAHFSEKATGMDAPSRAVADHLQTLWDAGVPMDAGFTALSQVGSDASYATALHSMTGRALGSIGAFRSMSSRDFVSTMSQGCDQSASTQPDCSWGRIQAGSSSQADSSEALGYQANTQTYEMGLQRDLGNGLTLAGAVGMENNRFHDTDNTGTVTGNGYLAGVGLRYDIGAIALTGMLDGGYGNYDSSRIVSVGNVVGQASAKPNVWNTGLHFQASYTQTFAGGYIRPFAELRGVYVHGNGYTESGNTPFNLAVDSQSQFSLGGGLGTEVGTTRQLSNGAQLKFHASGAIESGGGNDWRTRAQFVGTPTSDTFNVGTHEPDTYGRIGVGMDLLNWKNFDFSLNYDLGFGSGYHSSTGIARVDWRF